MDSFTGYPRSLVTASLAQASSSDLVLSNCLSNSHRPSPRYDAPSNICLDVPTYVFFLIKLQDFMDMVHSYL